MSTSTGKTGGLFSIRSSSKSMQKGECRRIYFGGSLPLTYQGDRPDKMPPIGAWMTGLAYHAS